MDKLLDILKSTGFPCAYDHFAEGEAPEPPFLCYLLPGSDNFSADGKVYYRISEVRVELYTDQKNLAAERKLEDALDACGIFYEKSRPGSTVKSCMKSCMCLRCRQVRKAQGRTDKEMEGAGYLCEEE